jgi:hypothetical protein
MQGPKSIEVSLNLPFNLGGVKGTWEPDENERTAAWQMYVELITRISVAGLASDEGLLREALSSLYSLFDTTRAILREHGPTVAQAKGNGKYSFGYLAVIILNQVLRPVLAKWHPLLLDYGSRRPPNVSEGEYERAWPQNQELRDVLRKVRGALGDYAELLAGVAAVPTLPTDASSFRWED